MASPQQNQRQAAVTRASDVSAFKARVMQDLELPSGNICQVRRMGMTMLLRKGVIPNSLLPMLQQAQGKDKDSISRTELVEILEDPTKIDDMMGMYDKIVCLVVNQPKVYPLPEDEVERDPERLYVDEIDDEDKQHIATWAMSGTKAMEPFRDEQDGDVAGRQDSNPVEPKTKPARRSARSV